MTTLLILTAIIDVCLLIVEIETIYFINLINKQHCEQ